MNSVIIGSEIPFDPEKKIKVKQKGRELEKLSQKEFEALFSIKYLPHLHFDSYQSLASTMKACPLILKSFLGSDNRAYATQYHPQLEKGYVANVAIVWIDDTVGYGLFANEDFPPDAYIGEYTGLVRRMKRLNPNYNRYSFHYPTRFWSWHYTLIDAQQEGNETRFINHSEQPNLQPFCIVDSSDLLHLCFKTATFIPKGKELTFNYGYKIEEVLIKVQY